MNGDKQVALWSALVAAFSYLLALGIFDVINPANWVQYLGALIVAVITGGAVYSKQRLDAAKKS